MDTAGWAPYAIQQPLGYERTGTTGARQARLAEFAEFWARNIEDQGWLEHATVERAEPGLTAEREAA